MGMYDTILGQCPHCGAEYDCQTKTYDNVMDEYIVGSVLPNSDELPLTHRLQLKNPCGACGGLVIAVVQDSVLTGLARDNPTHREEIFRRVIDLSQD